MVPPSLQGGLGMQSGALDEVSLGLACRAQSGQHGELLLSTPRLEGEVAFPPPASLSLPLSLSSVFS